MFILILFVIGIILGIIFAVKEEEFGTFLMGLLITLSVCVFWLLFSLLIIPDESLTEIVPDSEIKIIALNDNIKTEGGFFLGAGTIDSDLYYWYMTEDEDGGKQIQNIKNSHRVKIYDNEKESPYIKLYYKRNPSSALRFFFIAEDPSPYVEFHIPPNSIKQNFNIDLN